MIKIKSVLDIVDNYDNFIIDQWGVMHDGVSGYKHAIETINHLEYINKNLFIISNSSKRQISSRQNLSLLGFKEKSFINILTSGEMIWQTIQKEYSNSKSKKKCLHIYDVRKEDGLSFRNGLNLNFTNDIFDADFILGCTPFFDKQPIDYIPLLEEALKKNLKMYCANPDFETIEKNSDQNIFCIGAIAEIYKKMGGNVIIQGKPEIDIYLETTKSIKIDKSRTIAIGDSLFHDIKGANNFGIDSILVQSGIHKDIKTIYKLSENHKISSTYLIEDFVI